MHYSFTGVVLDQVKYSDSSTIVKLLTRELGLQSVVVKGLKGKRGKSIRPLLNKMNIVEVEAVKSGKADLGVLKNIRSSAEQGPQLDVKKASVALFVNEFLCRTIREGHEDPQQFEVVSQLMQALQSSTNISDLHLVFMLNFTETFGIRPETPAGKVEMFDLLEGAPCATTPGHGHFIEGALCAAFIKGIGTDLAINASLGVSNEERRSLLEKILEYYSLQLDEKLDLRSHKVLHTVLE